MALTKQQIEEISQSIKLQLEQVAQDLVLAKDSAKPVSLEDSIGRLSRIDAIQQQQVALNHKTQLEQRLKTLRSALERLKTNDFGLCRSCEEEIDFQRLLLKPESIFCIKCLRQREAR